MGGGWGSEVLIPPQSSSDGPRKVYGSQDLVFLPSKSDLFLFPNDYIKPQCI